MTPILIASIALAALLLRAGWGGMRGAAASGWVLAGIALIGLVWRDGAWGLSIGLSAGSIAALLLVLQAGAVSPARSPRAPRRGAERAAIPSTPSRLAISRRLVVFLLTVPVSFIAAEWLAFAILAAMKGSAALDANSVATMLFVQPTVWALLMSCQMMLPGPLPMALPPALAASLGALIWIAG